MSNKTPQMRVIELQKGDTIENILKTMLQEKSVRATASELGVSHQTIHNWLDSLSIERKELVS